MRSRKRVASTLAISAIAGALMLGVLATAAQAAVKHFDGTVLSKNAAAKTFRISTQSGAKTFKVNASTEFERIAGGFGGLHKGLAIEVDAVQSSTGLVAKQVEPQGGNGGGGGDSGGHGGGNDDGPNHT
jgi:phage baseplate assembly protein gpV